MQKDSKSKRFIKKKKKPAPQDAKHENILLIVIHNILMRAAWLEHFVMKQTVLGGGGRRCTSFAQKVFKCMGEKKKKQGMQLNCPHFMIAVPHLKQESKIICLS